MAKKIDAKPTFEQASAELETLVAQMERGDLSLEQSLQAFERGVQLSRQCQQALQEAEQKVEILLQRQGDLSVATFEAHE